MVIPIDPPEVNWGCDLVCERCGRKITQEEVSMGYNVGFGPVYLCTECLPPPETEQQLDDLIGRLMVSPSTFDAFQEGHNAWMVELLTNECQHNPHEGAKREYWFEGYATAKSRRWSDRDRIKAWYKKKLEEDPDYKMAPFYCSYYSPKED